VRVLRAIAAALKSQCNCGSEHREQIRWLSVR
jgi:hypothetical protein